MEWNYDVQITEISDCRCPQNLLYTLFAIIIITIIVVITMVTVLYVLKICSQLHCEVW